MMIRQKQFRRTYGLMQRRGIRSSSQQMEGMDGSAILAVYTQSAQIKASATQGRKL
jgi:hypothetical protein